MIQYGLTSFGLRCGSNGVFRKPIPGVYTSIAYHRYWIDEQIERFKGSKTSTTTKGVTTEPGSVKPRSTGSTEPGSTEPGSTEPGSTEPASTEPGSTKPGSTEPGSTKPGSTDLESCVKGCLKWNEQCATKPDLNFVKSLNLS